MLVANPFISYEACPRVISEVRKDGLGCHKDQNRHRLSGELLVKYGKEQPWWPRKVCIRGGQLHVGGGCQGDVKSPSLKIPLRRLSLSAGALPNSLCLIRGQNIVITLQTTTETSFDTWVKAIAIELIRQTPLEDIKYFDILTIEKCWKNKDQNANCLNLKETVPCDKCLNRSKVEVKEPVKIFSKVLLINESKRENDLNVENNLERKNRRLKFSPEKLRIRSKSCNAVERNLGTSPDENSVEILLKKCQNSENYVPVKEKLLLFETLCRLGRKVRSTEDVSLEKHEGGTKRAKSLHDLSFNSAPVKEICQYFETKGGTEGSKMVNRDERKHKVREQRLIYSDSSLNVNKTKSFYGVLKKT